MNSSVLAAEAAENLKTFQNSTCCSNSSIETVPINPDFVEPWEPEPIDLISFVEDEIYVSGAGYKPSPVDLSELSEPEETAGRILVGAWNGEIPSAYDLRNEGKLTGIGNQGQIGSCWAFSSIASLESYLLGTEGESNDFSENNMKNLVSESYSEGFDLSPEDGGNAFMAAAYLSRWDGPVNESEDPYSDSSIYSPTGLSAQKRAHEILFLPVRSGYLDNNELKKAILEYGAIYSTMYWNQAYYQETNYTYRCTTSLTPNHAITLVGWDDSFDRNKFSQVPPGDGAFIVKNSWGENWGENGYFYISYYDARLGYDENAVFTAEERDTYDYNYQYDSLGWVVSKEYSGSTVAWGGNVFSSESDETLRAVGFYTTDLNTTCEIYIYKNPVNGPINSRKIYTTKETGTYSLPGYHTKKLSSPVSLSPRENFSVVIKFSNPSSGGPLAVEQPIVYYSSKAQANSGESYVSSNGASWEDISGSSEANLCIKAFTTTDVLPEANFSSNITGGENYPLTVQFTDLSENAFSWEWDLNGDGQIDSTVQNPIYTYNNYGNYNVSLKVSNRNGIDSATKNNYVIIASSVDWNPWDNITSLEGENVSTTELQQAIHIYVNGLQITETEAEMTIERLKELINLWKESS